MAVFEYRIHPSVGIARMGDSDDVFFVGREVPVDRFEPVLEIIPGGNAAQLTSTNKPFRDKSNKLAKQGARFRIFCLEYPDIGSRRDAHPTKVWEVTAADYDIVWKVKVANKKSKDLAVPHPNTPAEQTFSSALAADVRKVKVFTGSPAGLLPLGSAFLEAGGQLIVLGSNGKSRPITGTSGSETGLRWQNWEDDAADGYVKATVTPKAGSSKADKGLPGKDADKQAWVVINMPNYGVDLLPPVTLYHIALNHALFNTTGSGFFRSKYLAAPITYREHIEILVKGYAGYKYVSPEARRGMSAGANRTAGHATYGDSFYRKESDAASAAGLLFALLRPAWDTKKQRYENYWVSPKAPHPVVYTHKIGTRMPNLEYLAYPELTYEWMHQWSAGSVPTGRANPFVVTAARRPWLLDLAHMCSMSGGSFYPGIEVGREAAYYKKWVADYGASPIHVDIRFKGTEGELTQNLALPWQSDFVACDNRWWPASRPIEVTDGKGSPLKFYNWMHNGADELDDHGLIADWMKLGFVRFQPASHQYHEDSRILGHPPGAP